MVRVVELEAFVVAVAARRAGSISAVVASSPSSPSPSSPSPSSPSPSSPSPSPPSPPSPSPPSPSPPSPSPLSASSIGVLVALVLVQIARAEPAVLPHAGHGRRGREGAERPRGNLRGEPVDDRQLPGDAAAQARQEALGVARAGRGLAHDDASRGGGRRRMRGFARAGAAGGSDGEREPGSTTAALRYRPCRSAFVAAPSSSSTSPSDHAAQGRFAHARQRRPKRPMKESLRWRLHGLALRAAGLGWPRGAERARRGGFARTRTVGSCALYNQDLAWSLVGHQA